MNLNILQGKAKDGGELLILKGELDAYTAPKLKETLLELVDIEGASVTLDLSDTNYMDSTGIGVIIAAYKKVCKNNGTLIVQGLTPRVERLFDITGLSDIITIEDINKEETR
ncbi:anti-sigma factor antagonist [Pullulanibacillus camelliae]|uniref:Anti-sigma factor antagonist n=1 Tax=Pullulanibacillus camelliae TaxID=1707096 RepID=A0A8J2YBT6_9BACL|nr:STAS domain-containing protein [Pullulanibacillus camelliae]GGE34435.1 anti-sigma factor antagonist [Pullulanibacillus camelliae]